MRRYPLSLLCRLNVLNILAIENGILGILLLIRIPLMNISNEIMSLEILDDNVNENALDQLRANQ